MPGSISTVTTPALNMAKTSEMKSMLGGTMREPRPGPRPIEPTVRQQIAVIVQLAGKSAIDRFACRLNRGRAALRSATPSGFARAVCVKRKPTLTTDTADLRGHKIDR